MPDVVQTRQQAFRDRLAQQQTTCTIAASTSGIQSNAPKNGEATVNGEENGTYNMSKLNINIVGHSLQSPHFVSLEPKYLSHDRNGDSCNTFLRSVNVTSFCYRCVSSSQSVTVYSVMSVAVIVIFHCPTHVWSNIWCIGQSFLTGI